MGTRTFHGALRQNLLPAVMHARSPVGERRLPLFCFLPFCVNAARTVSGKKYKLCVLKTISVDPFLVLFSQQVAEDEAINEVFPKAVEELMAPDGWVHHEFELNTLGRCVKQAFCRSRCGRGSMFLRKCRLQAGINYYTG